MAAQGTAIIDFGAFPGAHETSVAVTGQASIVAGSLVEAWLRPVATSDHSADEHIAEFIKIRIIAYDIVAGTGFTIRAFYDGMQEPLTFPNPLRKHITHTTTGNNFLQQPTIVPSVGGTVPRIYGQWTVAWVWN